MACFCLLVSLSLTASFQNSLKTRIKLHKIMHKMHKKIVCGDGDDGKEGGVHVSFFFGGAKSAMAAGV